MSDRLRDLLESATPGPWEAYRSDAPLIALAPDMARLLIDMGEELRAIHNGPGEVNYTPRIPPLLARLDALGETTA